MPEHRFFKGGEWNANCDICGRTFKASALSKCWDNSMRCTVGGITGRGCWEMRHPQDFVRGIEDDQSTAWVRTWAPNLPQSTLAQNIVTLGAIAKNVAAGTGGRFPQPNGVDNCFMCALMDPNDPTRIEYCAVAGIVGDNLAFFDRGFRGTTAQKWDIGTIVQAITGLIPAPPSGN